MLRVELLSPLLDPISDAIILTRCYRVIDLIFENIVAGVWWQLHIFVRHVMCTSPSFFFVHNINISLSRGTLVMFKLFIMSSRALVNLDYLEN